MRRFLMFAGLSLIALAGCGVNAEAGAPPGSTSAGQRSFEIGQFASVSLGGYQNVVVTVGPDVSVTAEGPQNELDLLEIDVKDDELRIRTKRGNWRMGGDRKPVVVRVSVPSLSGATIGGSGDMTIDRVESDRFAAAIGGSGNMDIGSLKAREANFSIAGSGNIRAVGNVDTQTISIAGSGDMELGGVNSRSATVSVVGSGDVNARATENAQITIMGSGNVMLSGGAKCGVRKAGSGEVVCRP